MVEALTWAFDAIASRRILGEKSLSLTFVLLELLESLDVQGVLERDCCEAEEGVVLSSNSQRDI
jgi:hypothetical protein